jgi:intracellular septation protein
MTSTEHQTKETEATAEPEFDRKQALKLAVELGPLIAFIVAYKTLGIFWATGATMTATGLLVAVSYMLYGRLSTVMIITAAVVFIFGSLTLWFNDPRFAYIKPTIINAIFALVLAGGLLRGKSLLKIVLGENLHLTDEGWRILTIRWAIFFAAMAIVNEAVWRLTSENTWAYFKFPGMLILNIVFAASQAGVMKRSLVDPKASG